MEENYQGYNQPEYENDDPRKGANKSILGYRIVIIILAVILAAITVLYYNIHRQQQADYDLLVIDRDSIQNNLSDLMQDFDDLQLSNDTLSLQMGIERQRADSLMQRLKQERSWSLAKIKQYEKRSARCVPSCGVIFTRSTRSTRSTKADRRKRILPQGDHHGPDACRDGRREGPGAQQQSTPGIGYQRPGYPHGSAQRPQQGGVAHQERRASARGFHPHGQRPGNSGREDDLRPHPVARRIRAVERKRSDFEFEGERLSYSASRDVDYQNEDLNIGIFYTGSGFTAGTYQVQIYCDGFLIGSTELPMR